MRSAEFLLEDGHQLLRTVNAILSDCQPFLQATKSGNMYTNLFRGVPQQLEIDMRTSGVGGFKSKVTKGRRPRDTAMRIHEVLDKYFFDTFGIKYRSDATFATGDKLFSCAFGVPCMFFPVGNFDYCWSPFVRDLTEQKEIERMDSRNDIRLSSYLAVAEVFGVLDDLNYSNNKSVSDFRNAISSGNEIMIHCDEYYVVSGTYSNFLYQFLEYNVK